MLNVRPAARAFPEGKTSTGKLAIGRFDYWAFDANVGDVMAFTFKSSTFAQRIWVSNPNVDGWMWTAEMGTDQVSKDWKMVSRRPGKYLVAISCLGDGGGGDYSLSRSVIHPKDFGKGSQASGVVRDGQTQVWKITAKPSEPMLMHWKSSGPMDVSVFDENGSEAFLPLTRVDDSNQFGIINVDRPTSYLIVLTGTGSPAVFEIGVQDIPGYAKKKP
jgi:hypothetical protein